MSDDIEGISAADLERLIQPYITEIGKLRDQLAAARRELADEKLMRKNDSAGWDEFARAVYGAAEVDYPPDYDEPEIDENDVRRGIAKFVIRAESAEARAARVEGDIALLVDILRDMDFDWRARRPEEREACDRIFKDAALGGKDGAK